MGLLLIAAYAAALIAPLIVAALVRPRTHQSLLYELGKSCALVAAVILALQLVLAGRFRGISRQYGLDMVLRFHRGLAVFALVLIVLHPILLASGGGGWSLLVSLHMPWYIWLGKLALLLLIVQGATSLARGRIGLDFEKWRTLHNQAVVVLGLVFLHSWAAGSDLRYRLMQLLWPGLFAAAGTAYAYHKLRVWEIGRRRAYQVSEVTQEARNVWTVSLAPVGGDERFEFLPGQFHFLRLYRGDSYDGEEHPFTIACSPTETGRLSSTIKESGDFTRTIGRTRPGHRAAVQGPFGRFSHLLHPEETDLTLIGGGVGITPLMSMLRYMRDTVADLDVLLLYGNRTEDDIVFRGELEDMAQAERPRVKVVHVLSQPGESWAGETGYMDRATIVRHCGKDLRGKAFYVCGPPPMMDMLAKVLRELEVSATRIHRERFSL